MKTAISTIDTTNIFYIKTFTYSYTISANAYKDITASNFKFSAPVGYQVFSFSRFDTGHSRVALCSIAPGATTGMMCVKNMGSAITSTITASMTVVLIKKEFIKS